MVHCVHESILRRHGDMVSQRQWGHDLDLLGSRDVINHVTIQLTISHFLWVVRCDHASILHRYGYMAPQSWTLVDGCTNRCTDAQVILYSVQCYALHYITAKQIVLRTERCYKQLTLAQYKSDADVSAYFSTSYFNLGNM